LEDKTACTAEIDYGIPFPLLMYGTAVSFSFRLSCNPCAHTPPSAVQTMQEKIDRHLALPREQREAGAEAVFMELATFTAAALSQDA